MVLKIAAEDSPSSATLDEVCMVVVREYNEESDKVAVEEMERLCEMAGQRGGKQPSLVTDLLGDPKCRIRHFPTHIMLVRLQSHYLNISTCDHFRLRMLRLYTNEIDHAGCSVRRTKGNCGCHQGLCKKGNKR